MENNGWFVSSVSSRTLTRGMSLVKATLLKQQQKRATAEQVENPYMFKLVL